MGFFEDLKSRIEAAKFSKKPPSTDAEVDKSKKTVEEVCSEPFDGPLPKLPKNRTEVYQIYGRPVKEDNPAHNMYPKAVMITANNLPGSWNNNSHKLYMLGLAESYLREALSRCEQMHVLDYITSMGCYNHRHIRFDSSQPLSYHSWGMAVDLNPADNALLYKTKIKIGPPFSKQWFKVYPKSVPYELVMAFNSVGFTWGGDWAKQTWKNAVLANGVGYDAGEDPSKWPADWQGITYTDPMHFELVKR